MEIKYKHTSLVSKDYKQLAQFYINVFKCFPASAERIHKGDYLKKGTGVNNAALKGIHLGLPGFDKNGPTLEIFEYEHMEPGADSFANQKGLRHLAFEVSDVQEMSKRVLEYGGSELGEIVTTEIADVGDLTFVYMKDPDGNIIEIMNWEKVT